LISGQGRGFATVSTLYQRARSFIWSGAEAWNPAELDFLLRGATEMRKLVCKSGIGICLALLPSAACAATQEELLGMLLGQIQMYVLIVFVIVVIAGVYFMQSRDKRQTPLNRIFEGSRAIHSIGPDASITECVRLMTAGKIGALMVMDGGRLMR
jgi:CBS domain-containing protein